MLDAAALARFGERERARRLRAGVDWLQVRDRSLDGAALLAATDRALAAARGATRRVRVLVNRRVDVALAAGADGVHLGFDALPADGARALLGRDAWIGVSLHEPAEIGARAAPTTSTSRRSSRRSRSRASARRSASRRCARRRERRTRDRAGRHRARERARRGRRGRRRRRRDRGDQRRDDPARAARALRSALRRRP